MFMWFSILFWILYHNYTCYGITCDDQEFACADGSGCIPADKFCEWHYTAECSDRSDERRWNNNNKSLSEIGIPCRRDDQTCVLPLDQISKKEHICIKNTNCSDQEFACEDGSGCLEYYHFCGGLPSCYDNSDEIRWNNKLNQSDIGIPCRSDYATCVLPWSQISKKDLICYDDENCTEEEFKCEDGSGCISGEDFCEIQVTPTTRFINCADRSDERLWNDQLTDIGIPCPRYEHTCLLPMDQKSKKDHLCTKDINCTKEEFACKDGSGCISAQNYCQEGGIEHDCNDRSDENHRFYNWEPGIPCRPRGSETTHVCLLPESQEWKAEFFCQEDHNCTHSDFRCADGRGCFNTTDFCDDFLLCRDGSDETRWTERLQLDGEILCDKRTHEFSLDGKCVLPRRFQCDGQPLCMISGTAVDECLCSSNENMTYYLDANCFRCLSNPHMVFPIRKLCDKIIDCPDLSDECLCQTKDKPKICNTLQWELPNNKSDIITRNFSCSKNNETITILETDICNGKSNCSDRTDEADCSRELTGLRAAKPLEAENIVMICDVGFLYQITPCDGKIECAKKVYREECHYCNERPGFCDYVSKDGKVLLCNTTSDWEFVEGEVDGDSICDGIVNCLGMEDELYCSNKTHFACHDGLSPNIQLQKRCDQVVDCVDESDELDCSFKCGDNGSTAFVHPNQVCDGAQNCDKGADEIQEHCIKSAFSDARSLLKEKKLLAVLYIISLVALCGNIMVLFLTLKEMKQLERNAQDSVIQNTGEISGDSGQNPREPVDNSRETGRNSGDPETNLEPPDTAEDELLKRDTSLILNLSIADTLVAIYTMAICIKSSLTEGQYLLEDRQWRTGNLCSILGCLLVIGSEQSVFTMVLITFSRLTTTSSSSDKPTRYIFWIVLTLTWIGSIALGVVPLLSSLEDTFTTSVWYANNELFATIQQKEIEELSYWLLLVPKNPDNNASHGQIGSWSTLETLISQLNPNLTVSRRYGFYSSHTVCLPDIFPDRANKASWWYSLMLVIINFTAFIAIFVGYVVIYSKQKPSTFKKLNKFQQKVTYIVITDFFCWFPVCFMAFLQLSGVNLSDDFRLIVGMFIIPINSAINPIIYADLPKKLKDEGSRIIDWISNRCCCCNAEGTDENSRDENNCQEGIAMNNLPESNHPESSEPNGSQRKEDDICNGDGPSGINNHDHAQRLQDEFAIHEPTDRIHPLPGEDGDTGSRTEGDTIEVLYENLRTDC